MTPMLGIMASQISGHLFAPSGAYDSIATTTLTTTTGSVTFSSIPATYTHLQIRIFAFTAGGAANTKVQFNSDTGANYAWHQLYGDGGSVGANAYTAETGVKTAPLAGSTTIAGVGVIDILDYANTSKYTTVRTLGGHDNNGSGYSMFRSGLWLNTAAISTIVLAPDSSSFTQYSRFALYGIKGA